MKTLVVPAALPRSAGGDGAEHRREDGRCEEGGPDGEGLRPGQQAQRGRHRPDEEEAGRRGAERPGGQAERSHAVRQLRERHPAGHHREPEQQQDDAPGLDPHRPRVQHREGGEPRHRRDTAEQPKPGDDRGTVQQRGPGRLPARLRPGLRHARRDERSEGGEDTGAGPGRPEPGPVQQPLPEHGSRRDTDVEGQRAEAQRLAGPPGRREVGERGEAGDEEHRVRRAHEQAQGHEPGEPGNQEVPEDHHGEHRRAADEELAAAATVGPPASQGPQQQGGEAERAHREADADLARPQRTRDEQRGGHDEHAGPGEVGQVRECQGEERRGEQADRLALGHACRRYARAASVRRGVLDARAGVARCRRCVPR
jgi:hypothetical protein